MKRARESFCYWDDNGVPHDVPAGSLIDTTKVTFFKGREHLFEDVEMFVDSQYKSRDYRAPSKVEDATAEPGNPRDVSTTPKPKFTPPATKDS